MTSFMLACNRFSGCHTADNIAANFQATVGQFSTTGSVSHVVTNNAAKMKNAFPGLPGFDHNDISESDSEEEE